MKIGKSFAALILPLLFLSLVSSRSSTSSSASRPTATADDSSATFQTVHNDFYWLDTDGNRIYTRSGCIRQFNGVFYWYGGKNRFLDHTLYTSTDLAHWTYKGVVLHTEVDANRLDVLYNASTKQYVMFLKYNGNGAHLGIATCDQPEGPFKFISQTLIDGNLMGDFSMFQDSDGKAYLCYVWWNGGPNRQHGIYLMSPDYLTLDKRIYLWETPGREAPHMIKRNGIYYYGTSRTAGIRSSGTSYYTATNIAGPWSDAKPLKTPGSDNSWDTQVNFVIPITGAEGTFYLFDGDRWVKNGGREGDYAWLPMEFDGDTPTVNYYQDWDLSVATGIWRKFDPARDLARGKKATASSEDPKYPAVSVTAPTTYLNYADGGWESKPSDPQWIMVDLGAQLPVNRVILKWFSDYGKSFSIQTSLDGTSWTDVYKTDKGASYSVTDAGFPTTEARYVRMYGTKRGTTDGYSIFNFLVLKD